MYSYESAGNVTIIIRALHQTNLMGVNYEAGDVVSVFENAYFSLRFANNNKQITQGSKTILNYNNMSVDSIMIDPKSLTHTAYNFLAANYNNSGNILVPMKENIVSDQTGLVFLNYIPTNQKKLFIKNDARENVAGYTVDYTTGQITGLAANTKYICFYYRVEEKLSTYNLKEVQTPYFEIEITGQNNINNVSREMLINIPKASIDIAALMEFKEEQITAIQLKFIVIDGIATINYY
jgi:hypothetical protein